MDCKCRHHTLGALLAVLFWWRFRELSCCAALRSSESSGISPNPGHDWQAPPGGIHMCSPVDSLAETWQSRRALLKELDPNLPFAAGESEG